MLNPHKKCQGIAKDASQGSFYLRRPGVNAKFFLVGLWCYRPLYKNLAKTTELSFCRLTIQELIFLCPIPDIKAVAMGMATARALLGSHKPNPAI